MTHHQKTIRSKTAPILIRTLITIALNVIASYHVVAQIVDSIMIEDILFKSQGVNLSGTIYTPKKSHAAVVIVHGSDQVPRMSQFAEMLSQNGITVLTYDKRGVGASEGIYAGPEVGTNNIDSTNLHLLAEDASAAVNILHQKDENKAIGLIGFSQAGWIIPIAANKNPLVRFMVLFSGPTITTLEQLRFQFYTDGRTDFWDNHTIADANEHIQNDPDRYSFTDTDPKDELSSLSIPGLWLFGEQDIQIPVKRCIEQLNTFKAQGKPFEYTLFPTLGHSTASATTNLPVTISLHWIMQQCLDIHNSNN